MREFRSIERARHTFEPASKGLCVALRDDDGVVDDEESAVGLESRQCARKVLVEEAAFQFLNQRGQLGTSLGPSAVVIELLDEIHHRRILVPDELAQAACF